jgi:polyphosphate kinase 2 (PPK2 family)
MPIPDLAKADLRRKLPDEETYDDKLKAVQTTLLQIQQAYLRQGRRGIVVLEGADAAGKGSLVRRLSARLDPRYCYIWPIAAPNAIEQNEHYLERFWRRMPDHGELAVFDRSWYGRVRVERVEKLIEPPVWKRAYREIVEFERMLVDDGIRVIKIFLHISPEEQLRRFEERMETSYKRWKLTPDDLRNRSRWDAYIAATGEMFEKTSSRHAPWNLVASDFKWWARIRGLEIIAKGLGDGIDLKPPPCDPELARAIRKMVRKAKKGRRALKP